MKSYQSDMKNDVPNWCTNEDGFSKLGQDFQNWWVKEESSSRLWNVGKDKS